MSETLEEFPFHFRFSIPCDYSYPVKLHIIIIRKTKFRHSSISISPLFTYSFVFCFAFDFSKLFCLQNLFRSPNWPFQSTWKAFNSLSKSRHFHSTESIKAAYSVHTKFSPSNSRQMSSPLEWFRIKLANSNPFELIVNYCVWSLRKTDIKVVENFPFDYFSYLFSDASMTFHFIAAN